MFSIPEPYYKSTIDVRLIDKMGDDTRLAAAAWVSTSAEEGLQRAINNPNDVSGVINYLIKHRHGTPFEHSAITFFVHAPIFVWREWHRHRIGMSYNEESGRYKTLDPVFYIPDRERPMMKVDGWKPGKPKFTRCEDNAVYYRLCQNLKGSYTTAYENYIANLAMNIDPGLARDCLPVGIYSSCWVTCNPRSLMHFLSLRVHEPDATFVSYPLYEIDLAARMCEETLKQGWPITYAAFVKNGRVAP
jgi:thymidylate synthase (FAD)